MNISAPFIRRPVATILLSVAILLAGIVGYLALPVSSLPQVDFPTIQVTAKLPGANGATMEALVTAPLERQLGQIASLASLTSTSTFGQSEITLQFDLTRDIDGAAQDVQAAINAASANLPRGLPYPPVYSKVNPADIPMLTLVLTSDQYPLRDMSDLADTMLAQRLSQIDGVGRVDIQGGVRPAIRVQVDLSRLSNYGLGMEDVRLAIVAANVSGAKGSLDSDRQSYTIASNDQIVSVEAYANIIVTQRGGAPIYLKDVAAIVEGFENTKTGGWYNGKPAIILDVKRQPGANTIATVQRLRAEVTRLRQVIPAGVRFDIISDRTSSIRASIHDVQFTLILSVFLVVLVVFFFLRSLAATLIAGAALPLSLIATFAIMKACGFSLNNLTLMALTISTGFVIDDAIVMIENIVRHLDQKKTGREAAIDGAREIGFTVVSLTLSLIAVFIPLLFMSGLVGRMFREFAFTLSIAVLVSAVISLTLTPMMCAALLRGESTTRKPSPTMTRMMDAYHRSIIWAVDHARLVLGVTFGTIALTIGLYLIIPKGFLPLQDSGMINATIRTDPALSFDKAKAIQRAAAENLAQDPSVAGVMSFMGVGTANAAQNVGRMTLYLHPREKRGKGVDQVIGDLQKRVAANADANLTFQIAQDIQISARAADAQYQYTIGGLTRAEVDDLARTTISRMLQSDIFKDVRSDVQNDGQVLFVNVDREVAGRLGVSLATISDALNSAFGQRQVSTMFGQSNQYRVILEASPDFQADTHALENMFIAASNGAQVQLKAIARLEFQTAPLTILHNRQFPAAVISFNLAQGKSLSDAVAVLEKVHGEEARSPTLNASFSGDTAEFSAAMKGQVALILAAIIAIYIVLGVLYESAIHPITILSTLPSAGVGALLALMLFRYDLSLVAMIGIILLMGIVKKNAIMMIDFALQAERDHGMTPRDAIVQAAILRLRPILMTTLAALLGAIPLAVESGMGSELRNPLGVTLIGGLLLSQWITLYSTPVIYLSLENLKKRFAPKPALHPETATPQNEGAS